MRPLAVGIGAAAFGAVLTPIVVPVGLSMIGFGPTGPVAGSIAAGMQASIGNVAAGSMFAAAQSIAMGGAVPATVTAAGAGITALTAAALVGLRRFSHKHGHSLYRGYIYNRRPQPYSRTGVKT